MISYFLARFPTVAADTATAVAAVTFVASVLALAFLCASPLFAKASAAVKRLALFGLLLAAIAALPAQLISRKIHVGLTIPIAAPTLPTTPRRLVSGLATLPSNEFSGMARRAKPVATQLSELFFLAWVIGCFLAALREWRGGSTVRTILRESRPLTDSKWIHEALAAGQVLGVAKPIRLFVSDGTDIPFVTGILYPSIIIPAIGASWGSAQRRSVLIHETAHVAQRDLALRAISRFACVIYWFNPLIWWIANREIMECERAADDLVLSTGLRPSIYAGALLSIAEQYFARDVINRAALALIGRATLADRINGVLSSGLNRRRTTRPMVIVSIASAIVIGSLLGCVTARRLSPGKVAARSVPAVRGGSDTTNPPPGLRMSTRDLPPSREPSATTPLPDVVGALIAALGDSSSHVRAAALRSLGRMTDVRIEPALRAAEIDPDSFVREEAERSLVQIIATR